MAASLSLSGNLPLSGSAATTASITFPPFGDTASDDVLTTLPPTALTTFSVHSVMSTLAILSAGTYDTIASCCTPAEKIILPTWPEQPLRSSAPSSGSAFIDVIASCSNSRSPSGDSIVVQKNSRPPISEAPSISTPFLPPSLITFFNSFSLSFAASFTGSFSSFFGASFSFFSFAGVSAFSPPFFLSFLSDLGVFAGASDAAGFAGVAAVAGAAASATGLPGSAAHFAGENDAMCSHQRSAFG
mmetsp:Transcript_52597/g.114742  ORF Transcript_52597/g.114742 Transcript_52597/m.114742 type:complete len:244 (-) Transcript_52597:158-889(-)